ncbi:MAG: 3-mercaptopyruvate sulfurtransferase [Gemmatimonadales bacterium]
MPAASSIPSVVSTAWLAERVEQPGVKVVDASWYLSRSGRDAAGEYLASHLPGAVFFDIDASSDQQSPLPHMLPTASEFATRMTRLGLRDDDTIVVYDGSGANLSAARAWWMFRIFGHRQVAVLDGGSRLWQAEGRAMESGPVTPAPGAFTARLDAHQVRSRAEVAAAAASGAAQVFDARSRARFEGREPEPRPGLRSGHISGSRSLPYEELVDGEGRLLPPGSLRARFEQAGIDWRRPVIASCGSGVTACALILALDHIGVPDASVYDGSWTEWGASGDVPVATGPAEERKG